MVVVVVRPCRSPLVRLRRRRRAAEGGRCRRSGAATMGGLKNPVRGEMGLRRHCRRRRRRTRLGTWIWI